MESLIGRFKSFLFIGNLGIVDWVSKLSKLLRLFRRLCYDNNCVIIVGVLFSLSIIFKNMLFSVSGIVLKFVLL